VDEGREVAAKGWKTIREESLASEAASQPPPAFLPSSYRDAGHSLSRRGSLGSRAENCSVGSGYHSAGRSRPAGFQTRRLKRGIKHLACNGIHDCKLRACSAATPCHDGIVASKVRALLGTLGDDRSKSMCLFADRLSRNRNAFVSGRDRITIVGKILLCSHWDQPASHRQQERSGPHRPHYRVLRRLQCRLKYCTARSWASAFSRVANVPRLRRLPVFASFLREYKRYCPDGSLRIISIWMKERVREEAFDSVVSRRKPRAPQSASRSRCRYRKLRRRLVLGANRCDFVPLAWRGRVRGRLSRSILRGRPGTMGGRLRCRC
jgi:hypothetical protein